MNKSMTFGEDIPKPILSWEKPVGKVIRNKTDCIDSVIIFAQKMSDMKTVIYGFMIADKMCFMDSQTIKQEWEIVEE